MNPLYFLVLATFLCLSLQPEAVIAGKKKKKNKKSSPPQDDSKMFDPKTLKCLVCKNLIKEFDAAIWKIDPKKMIDTGTFRVNEKGSQERTIVSVLYFDDSDFTFTYTVGRYDEVTA